MKLVASLTRQLAVALLLCGPGLPALAQDYVDLFRIDYSISKDNAFDSGTGSSDVSEWVADLTLPVVLDDRNTLLTGFLFERVSLTPYAGHGDVSLHTLNVRMGLNRTFSDVLSATFLVLPKLSSDMKEVGSHDVQIGGLALFKVSRSPHFNLRFGAYTNTDLFGPFLVPIIGAYYTRNRFETTLSLPLAADANYQLNDSFRVGMRFNGFIKSFNLNEAGNGLPQYITKANNEIGAYLQWTRGNVHVFGLVGRSIGRSYRAYETDDKLDFAISILKLGDDRRQLNTDFEDGFVFKTSLLYRLNIDHTR